MASEKKRRVKFKQRTVYRSDFRFQTNPLSGKGIAENRLGMETGFGSRQSTQEALMKFRSD